MEATAKSLPAEMAPAKSEGRKILRRFLRNRWGTLGFAILAFVILAAIFAPLLAPDDPVAMDLGAQFHRPFTPGHLLGTDAFGRDLLSRVIWGARPSLLLALAATVASMSLGVTTGLAIGYIGGRFDMVVMRVVDVLLAFPYLLLAIVIVGALGPGLTNAMLAIAISGIPFYIRLVRGLVVSVRNQQHVEAAVALGGKDVRIVLKHVLPIIYPYLIVAFSLNAGWIILQASSLSFLGLGAQPPDPEWGALLADNRQFITMAPHVVLIPGAAILLVVLALNLMGDALRDALDVTLKDQL